MVDLLILLLYFVLRQLETPDHWLASVCCWPRPLQGRLRFAPGHLPIHLCFHRGGNAWFSKEREMIFIIFSVLQLFPPNTYWTTGVLDVSEASPPWRHRGRESLLRRRWSESCNCLHCHSPRAFAEFICCDITRYIRHYQHRIGRDPREKETLVRKRKSRTPPIFSQSPLLFSPDIIRSWDHNSCVPADARHWTLSEDDTFVCKYISQQIKNFSWISLILICTDSLT